MSRLNLAAVRNRQDRYLLDHYMNLHATLISRRGRGRGPRGSKHILVNEPAGRVVAVGHGGCEIASHGERVPRVAGRRTVARVRRADGLGLLFPLLVGVAEFVAFGLLVVGRQSFAERSSAPLGEWLFSVGVTCWLALLAIHRADRHIDPANRYSADLRPVAMKYKSLLSRDMGGALLVALGASASGVLAVLFGWSSIGFHVAALAGSTVALTIGVIVHQQTVNTVYALRKERDGRFDGIAPVEGSSRR